MAGRAIAGIKLRGIDIKNNMGLQKIPESELSEHISAASMGAIGIPRKKPSDPVGNPEKIWSFDDKGTCQLIDDIKGKIAHLHHAINAFQKNVLYEVINRDYASDEIGALSIIIIWAAERLKHEEIERQASEKAAVKQ